MHRLLIVIPIYAFVAIFMPQQDWFIPVTDAVRRIEPNLSIIISVAGIILAGVVYFGLRRFGQGFALTKPRLMQVVVMGCLGVFIAGIFDVFERLSGYATDIISLIVVPIAFMIAEGAFLALQWRMSRNDQG